MKKETKKLLEEITNSLKPEFLENWNELKKKIITIEEDLKQGGYIPDKNLTPCKHGDKILLRNRIKATLVWNSWKYKFTAVTDDKKVYELGNITDFVKL